MVLENYERSERRHELGDRGDVIPRCRAHIWNRFHMMTNSGFPANTQVVLWFRANNIEHRNEPFFIYFPFPAAQIWHSKEVSLMK